MILNYEKDYNADFSYDVEDEETLEVTTETASMDDLTTAADEFAKGEPDPADYGVWVPGIPVLIEKGLDAASCVDWLEGLILDGIVAGVGAVLGFVPQMLVLFILLAILKPAVTWLVSHSLWTVSSGSLVCPVSPLSRFWSAQAAAFRASWLREPLKTNVTAV